MKINKSFMNLSQDECAIVSNECIHNSKAKYEDALVLGNSGSYGSAVSFLVISLEERMKATILVLDSCGFEFRHKIAGIESIFRNHRLRYYLGFVLTLFNILSDELMSWLNQFSNDPEKIKNFKAEGPEFEKQIADWSIKGMMIVNKEIEWFKDADFFRQSGLYVDFADEVKSPLSASKDEFIELKTRIDKFNHFHSNFLGVFDTNNSLTTNEALKNIKGIFHQYHLYKRLGSIVKHINKRDVNVFEDLQSKIVEAFPNSDKIDKTLKN